jgi:hypothetical protein
LTAKEELEQLMYGNHSDQKSNTSGKPKKKAKVSLKPVPKGQRGIGSFFSMSSKKKKK